MKLSVRTFKIQWNLHGWLGLACAIPMFVMFYCGVFALFEDELEIWQEPAIWQSEKEPTSEPMYEELQKLLGQELELDTAEKIEFIRMPDTSFVLSKIGEDASQQRWIEAKTGKIEPRRSNLGHALNRLHYLGQLPAGTQLAGLFSVALMVLSVGGILILIKDIPKQIWTFRPFKKPKDWGADLHRVVGLWALPFIFIIAWSGALLGVGGLFGAMLVNGDITKLQDLRGYGNIQYQASGKPATSVPVADMVKTAQRSTRTTQLPHYAGSHLRGDENAWGFVFFESEMVKPWRYVFIDAVTGEINIDTSHEYSFARAFEERLFGFHFAWFGGGFIRAVFSCLAWLVCAMIIAGQVIWIERPASRKRVRLRFLVERTTVGVCTGLIAASTSYFALNRLLPPDLAQRAACEWNGFLGIWLGLSALALWPNAKPTNIAALYLILSSAEALAVVAFDWLRLNPSGSYSDSVIRIHVLLTTLGLCCGGMALILRCRLKRQPESD